MQFDGDLDIKAREIEDLKRTPEELTRQAAMRWADGQIDPLLPLPPFFLQIVGGIGKGKTTIILNMLREYQRVNTFCRVIYLSPSGKNDAKLRMFLTADNSNFEYTEENLSKIIKEIEDENAELKGSSKSGAETLPTPAGGSQGLSPQELKRRIQSKVPPTLGAGKSAALSGLAGPKDKLKTKEDLAKEARKKVSCRTLIIADDATGSILTARNSPFVKFLVSIRHMDASVILCTHSETSLSAQLRNIVTGVILFEPGTGRELKSIVDDVGGVSQETLLNILGHVQRVPHGFVFIDKKRPFRDRFVLNFKNVMDPDAFRDAGPKGSVEGKTLELFRSGGFLPTPSQATASEAKFAAKAYQLQQEATLLNRGLTAAEKILEEQNATAKRKRQLESSARSETAKQSLDESIARENKRQRANDSIRVTSANRAAAFRAASEARLTQPSRAGGVLDQKFQRGVARNVAIATGGRRGIGGRSRRTAAGLGPLAQQLEENIKLQQELKSQKDALAKDEEARKAEAAATQFAPGEVGPFLPDETLINQHARDNPPPLPSGQLARPTPGLFPLRGQPSSILTDQVANAAKTFQERAAAQRAEVQQAAGAAAHGALMSQLRNELPARTEDSIFNATQQVVFENAPITQADAAAAAAVEPMNVIDSETKDEVEQEGPKKQDPVKVPLPPSPVPDPEPMQGLSKPNSSASDGPSFGKAVREDTTPLNAPTKKPFGPVTTQFTAAPPPPTLPTTPDPPSLKRGRTRKKKQVSQTLEESNQNIAREASAPPLNKPEAFNPLTATSAFDGQFVGNDPGPTHNGGALKHDLSGTSFEEERLKKREK